MRHYEFSNHVVDLDKVCGIGPVFEDEGADHFWTQGVDKKQNAKFSLSHKISLGSFRFYQS